MAWPRLILIMLKIKLGILPWVKKIGFSLNENCGKIHALWYTLIISAIINDLNPRVYIHYILTKVHKLRRGEIEPVTLLPDRINIKELERFSVEQIEFGKKMLSTFDTS